MKTIHFAVVGGDMRQAKLAELLAADGHSVSTFAVRAAAGERLRPMETAAEAVKDAQCVVMPLPISAKEMILNTPLGEGIHMIEQIFAVMRPGQLVCAGRVSGPVYELAAKHGLRISDYYAREELVVANAVATAEGAIQLAMSETAVTLWNAKCLVLGFGRIGKLLAHRLRGLGAHVTVTARNHGDLAWIRAYGYEARHTEELAGYLGGYDVIFNTIPARVLPEERLMEVGKDCLCVDLSSKPGGMDFIAAGQLGLRAIWALSLPGEVAPVTSGIIIRDTIYHILEEERSLCG